MFALFITGMVIGGSLFLIGTIGTWRENRQAAVQREYDAWVQAGRPSNWVALKESKPRRKLSPVETTLIALLLALSFVAVVLYPGWRS